MEKKKYDQNKYIEFQGQLYVRYSYLIQNRGECIEYLDRSKYRTLDEPIIYFLDWENKNEYIVIPPNYVFDFNSSPRLTHIIVDRDEFCIALIHDALYTRRQVMNGYGVGVIHVVDRDNLSEAFRKLHKLGGVFTYNYQDNSHFFHYTRKACDRIWKEGAYVEQEIIKGKRNTIQVYLGYLGIRLGGWVGYKVE